MRAAHRRIEAALAQDLLDRVRAAPPDFFERLIVNLLLAMGYGGSVGEAGRALGRSGRSEEHTSELQSLMRISYAVFCLKKKKSVNTRSMYQISQAEH